MSTTSSVFRNQDIPTLLKETGAVPVSINGYAGMGILDWNDQLLVGDKDRAQVIVGIPMLTVQTSAFPNMAVGSTVIVDGNTYTVRERLKYGDSGLTKLFLGTAEP